MTEGLKGYNDPTWDRVVQTTLAQHIEGLEDASLRNFQFGTLLSANNRVKMNESGNGLDWRVKYRNHDVEGNNGQTARTFDQKNLYKTAFLPWRGYQATDAIFNDELKMNKGKEGLIKVFEGLGDRLKTSVEQAMGLEYYVDGAASGNSLSWHGFETMFGINGTLNITSGAQRAANAADKVGYPTGTYAGLSTALGNEGGENQTGLYWPAGIADPEFDYWSPLVVNHTSTAFGGSSPTFREQGQEAMRYGIINAQRNSSKNGQITNIFLGRGLYEDFLNLQDSKERTIITQENSLRAFGFKNVVNFDGLEVTWESGIGTDVGYGLNINCCELRCLDETLFKSEGPSYDIDTQSHKVVVSTHSNLKFDSPRNFFKLQAIA